MLATYLRCSTVFLSLYNHLYPPPSPQNYSNDVCKLIAFFFKIDVDQQDVYHTSFSLASGNGKFEPILLTRILILLLYKKHRVINQMVL